MAAELDIDGRPDICPVMVSSSMREGRLYTPIEESAAAEIVRQTRASGSRAVDTEGLTRELNFLFSSFQWWWGCDLAASRQGNKSIEAFASRITKLERDLTKSRRAATLQTGLMLGAYQVGATDEVYQAVGLQPERPSSGIPE